MKLLDESFVHWSVAPEQMDRLWAQGWRHFGVYFFRYSAAYHCGDIRTVIPLRIDLTKFVRTRSQRRVLAKNIDLEVIIRETVIDRDKEGLFDHHRRRFTDNIPDSVFDFLSDQPAIVPCRNQEICVFNNGTLVAASFLDIGSKATSAVYAMFEPSESRRSLGIFTMLEAIRYSQELGCRYYYPGYAYHGSSFYDYKKNFSGLESFDWESEWEPYSKSLHDNGRA